MLSQFKLKTGRSIYDSPYYIFVKDNGESSFLNLLSKYDIAYELNQIKHIARGDRFEFYVSSLNGWTTIMDNWWYSLYHLDCKYPFIDDLGKKYELFQCVVGDSDHSFGFKYHVNGKLRRHYEVSNPSYRRDDLRVEVDIGRKLEYESDCLAVGEEYEKVLNLAFESGVKLSKDSTIIQSYNYSVEKFIQRNI